MNDHWKSKNIQLQYQFVTLKLFSVPLRSLTFDGHFIELLPLNESLILPPLQCDPTSDCAFIPEYPIRQPLTRIYKISGYVRYISSQHQNYYIKMDGSFSEYLQKFSHKSRYNLLRSIRLYNTFCGCEAPWKEFKRVAEMEEFLRLAQEVEKKTYQKRLLGGGLPEEKYLLNKLKTLGSQDLIRCYILFHGSKPIAYLYCQVLQNGVVLYKSVGYDPEYRKWSPGTMLLYYALKSMFEEGRYQMFDFMRGGDPDSHKSFFSNSSVSCAEVYYFKCCLKNLIIIFSHAMVRVTSEYFIKILKIFRIKRLLKKNLIRLFTKG